ncbi:hypothetical protein MKZ38_007604 [Zalerion maritima]|uniref:Uncharacterized protein n=1 Tax=Zalerion maritima TaxID=339359 RepID=A0AAD5RUQ2_9PEZI|nr:hypothetical protein MKZ38_007604 [Zalerion maritima]
MEKDTQNTRPNPVPFAQASTSSTTGRSTRPLPSPSSSPSIASARRQRGDSATSSIGRQLRRASRTFEESNLPEGFLSATGDFASTILPMKQEPSSRPRPLATVAAEIAPPTPTPEFPISHRQTSFSYGKDGLRSSQKQVPSLAEEDVRTLTEDATSRQHPADRSPETGAPGPSATDAVDGSRGNAPIPPPLPQDRIASSPITYGGNATEKAAEKFDNGYHFPPKKSFAVSLKQGFMTFLRYSITPLGFFVVLYGLNVVAWGGMIFLLLCNAAPAMCHPTCNDIDSPRRKWIEYDSQILNALFCVTGFGLAPWRFRDLYFLLTYRLGRNLLGMRRLAGIHRGWLRLAGSERLPVDLGPDTVSAAAGSFPEESVPYPVSSIPDPPRTGVRAPPTRTWKPDFVVWMNVANTFLQCGLSAFMWGYDRYARPSWAVGLFVGLAMTVAAMAGIMIFVEGRRVKGIEGVPVTEEDLHRLVRDKELGIPHYNNIKDKKPKRDKEKAAVDEKERSEE